MLEPVFDEVLSAAQVGAEWAWNAIYGTYSGPVLGYMRSHGAREPEDLLSEVFMQLARNIDGFVGDERSFRSWVFVIAHHRVIDERRRRGRRPAVPTAEIREDASVAPDTTAMEAMRTMSTLAVRELLDELVPTQRDVLLLRLVAGLTVAEVAGAIGKSEGAVKALQRRGLASLSKLIANKGVPE